MQTMGRAGLAALLAVGLALPSAPVLANDTQPNPAEKLEEGVQNFLSAMKLFLLAIPQYAPPEVLPNGDIIIRRLNPGEQAPEPAPPADSHKI